MNFIITCEIALEIFFHKRTTQLGEQMRVFSFLKEESIWGHFFPSRDIKLPSRAHLGYLRDILKERVAPAMCNFASVLFSENAISYLLPVSNCHTLIEDASTRLHPSLHVAQVQRVNLSLKQRLGKSKILSRQLRFYDHGLSTFNYCILVAKIEIPAHKLSAFMWISCLQCQVSWTDMH